MLDINKDFTYIKNNSDILTIAFEPSAKDGYDRLSKYIKTDLLLKKGYTSSSFIPSIDNIMKHIHYKNIVKTISEKYKIIVPVDYPGFLLSLLEYWKMKKKKIVYLYPPQIWLWGRNRLDTLKYADAILTLYPFETEYLRNKGLKSVCIGLNKKDIEYSREGKILFLCGTRHPLNRKRYRKIISYGLGDNIIISAPGYKGMSVFKENVKLKGVFTFPSFSSLLYYESGIPVCNYIDNKILLFMGKKKGIKFFSAVNREKNKFVQKEIYRFPSYNDINNERLFINTEKSILPNEEIIEDTIFQLWKKL